MFNSVIGFPNPKTMELQSNIIDSSIKSREQEHEDLVADPFKKEIMHKVQVT